MLSVGFTSLAREFVFSDKLAFFLESLQIVSSAVQSGTISCEVGSINLAFAVRALGTAFVVLVAIKNKLRVIRVYRFLTHSTLICTVHRSTKLLETILDTLSLLTQRFVAARSGAGDRGDTDGNHGTGVGSGGLLELVSTSVASTHTKSLKVMSLTQQKITRLGEVSKRDLTFAIFAFGTSFMVKLRVQIQMRIVGIHRFLAQTTLSRHRHFRKL
mmetsp:Transcript_16264/g.30380  ORF Transcript_16264/g.30380 Transcript_16264/m.30380 type:complete len:215 (-) Transcript_16264:20-664(-)